MFWVKLDTRRLITDLHVSLYTIKLSMAISHIRCIRYIGETMRTSMRELAKQGGFQRLEKRLDNAKNRRNSCPT